MGRNDPVERGLDAEDEDLYDVATWEERTLLDRIAASVYGALSAGSRFVLVGIALLLVLAQFGFIGYAVLVDPTLGVLAALSVVPALALVGFVWYQNDAMREPLVPLAVTFLLAAVFASFAGVVNSTLGPAFRAVPVVGMALFFFVVVGPVEETVKWLGVRVYAYDTDDFDAVVDGAVYGAVAGLGFAAIENALYISRVALQQGSVPANEPLALASGIVLTRAFVGPGHVIYSAFAGYYLGLAKFNPENAGPIAVKGLLIAALVHGTYNTAVTYLPLGGLAFVGFVVAFDATFGYLLYRKLARYGDAHERATGETSGRPASAD